MPGEQHRIRLRAGVALLDAVLALPARARGLVVFAHAAGRPQPDGGSRSGRSMRVARTLQASGYATLELDLLTPMEEIGALRHAQLRHDVALLTQRLVGTVESVGRHAATRSLRLGLFGWGAVGAAALRAAADLPQAVGTVVAAGGHIELAADALDRVRAPALVLVGADDDDVAIGDTRSLLGGIGGPHRLEIVPDAGHLFLEDGALDRVAHATREWLDRHLAMHTPTELHGESP